MLDKFKTLLSDNKDAKEEEFEASQLAVASLMVTTALHDGEFDEIEKDVEPKEEPWFAKVGGWVLDKTEKIADWVSDKAPGIGSVGASGVKNAGKIAEKGAEIAEERAKSRIKDSQNLEDISTDQMEDNWGYWRKKGVLDSVVKLVKDNSPVSMGAAFGTLGGIVGGAAGLILSGGTPSPLVLGGISAGGMIGSAIGSTLNSIFS